MNQRQPRVEDAAWLAIVRAMPCLICGKVPSDPAHIRSSSLRYGKRQTGLGEKPSDFWVLPLCRQHHDEQHSGNELAWWAGYGIDPFAVALKLYGNRHTEPRRKPRRTARRAIPGKPMQSRNDLPRKGEVKFPKRRSER